MHNESVTTIPLIGPKQSKYLENLDIFTTRDLLYHIPFKYKDTSEIISIEELKKEREGTILAEVSSISNIWTRGRKIITKAKVKDSSGEINIVWFNQSFLTKNIKKGETFLFEGKMSNKSNDFSNPAYEKLQEKQTHLGKITPFYHETAGITSKWLRSRITWLKDKIPKIVQDRLPQEVLEYHNLIPLEQAIEKIHFAQNFEDIEKARKRLAFDEMLNISLQIERKKEEKLRKEAPKISKKRKSIEDFKKTLPFELTKDQETAIEEILEDMNFEKPMKRLLNGDVGSGKTIVAGIAAYNASLSGYSTVIMVPTTILAKQHYQTLEKLFQDKDIDVQLRITKKEIKPSKKPQLIVGTHALLYNTKLPENTGLVVVDEQHRFGVEQRSQISNLQNEKKVPHYLVMTATPIPRTLTSVIFQDMDISLILNKPKDRLPTKTYLINPQSRQKCYESIAKKIQETKNQEQAFVIFPLIEESEKIDAKAATMEYEKISKTWFKDIKTELLHGKMSEVEKNEILKNFKEQKIDALFATSVVEVGVDIPEATIMVIESAERFGLAQLHQFRGRIGRGSKQAYCFVIPHKTSNKIRERLKYFSENNSGFDVAEFDLQNRGPGEVYGYKQTGIPILKVSEITNYELLEQTREVAKYILDTYSDIDEIQDNLFK